MRIRIVYNNNPPRLAERPAPLQRRRPVIA